MECIISVQVYLLLIMLQISSLWQGATSHFSAEIIVLEVALFAISATLAAYCCKVVNCCSPAPKMVSKG